MEGAKKKKKKKNGLDLSRGEKERQAKKTGVIPSGVLLSRFVAGMMLACLLACL
jgi:hypothetical protein